MQLGLFQLSFGLLSVLILGLLNRLLIQDIQVPAALAALAVGAQQLMGFTRVWFGHRSDRRHADRLRRTPFILASSVAIAVLFGFAVQVVLQLADAMQAQSMLTSAAWFLALIGISVAIGTAIAAGGTAFSALVADRTNDQERPQVLSVVWAMRLLGVLLGTVLVNQVFGSACDAGAGRAAMLAGLDRLTLVVPLLLLGLGIASVLGVEQRSSKASCVVPNTVVKPQRLAPLQLLRLMGNIPQAGRFMAVLCLFTFSMFLNDAVLEPYGAAVFGMSVCATTALNASLALGFFVGMLFSGFQLIHRIGNIRASQWGGWPGGGLPRPAAAGGPDSIAWFVEAWGDAVRFVVGGLHECLPHADVQLPSARTDRISSRGLGGWLCLFLWPGHDQWRWSSDPVSVAQRW